MSKRAAFSGCAIREVNETQPEGIYQIARLDTHGAESALSQVQQQDDKPKMVSTKRRGDKILKIVYGICVRYQSFFLLDVRSLLLVGYSHVLHFMDVKVLSLPWVAYASRILSLSLCKIAFFSKGAHIPLYLTKAVTAADEGGGLVVHLAGSSTMGVL